MSKVFFNKMHKEVFFWYADSLPEPWLDKVVKRYMLISDLSYQRSNTWWGLYHRKRLKKVVLWLKEKNRKAVKKRFPNATGYNLWSWTDPERQRVPLLEVYYSYDE